MATGNVPTANLNAFYANTTPGVVADPAKIDAAVQDIVQTVNDNYGALVAFKQGTRYIVDGGAFTDTVFVNVIDGGTFA